jgi:hypothetical protein
MIYLLLYLAGIVGMLQQMEDTELAGGDWFHLLFFPLTVPVKLAKDLILMLWRIRNGS